MSNYSNKDKFIVAIRLIRKNANYPELPHSVSLKSVQDITGFSNEELVLIANELDSGLNIDIQFGNNQVKSILLNKGFV